MKLMYPIKIVVIDDDPTFTSKIEKILSRDDRLAVKTFNDSQLALKHIVNEKISFVISDINMPSLNGDELLYKLRDLKWPVRAAIISNVSNISVAYRCFALGADIYLKPITVDLVERITSGFMDRVFNWNSCVDKILSEKLKRKNANQKILRKVNKKYKLLLVEDDSEIREYSSDLLSDEYEVIEAENGLVALDKYNEADIVLLDINMPVMDGFQFLAEIEKNPLSKTPIIIVSGFIDNHCKFDYSNVVDVIEKPFDIKRLKKLIDSTLGSKGDENLAS